MNHQGGGYGLLRQKKKGIVFLRVCEILSAAVFLAVCTFILIVMGNGTQTLFRAPSSQLSEGWTDGMGNAVTLPAKISYLGSELYTLSTVVPEKEIAAQDISLMFSAKYLNVTLFLDGEEIGGCYGRPEETGKIIGKTFMIVKLPEEAVGKELRIEAVPLLGADMEYEISAPVLGTGERLVYELINSELFMLVILEAIFCFGLLHMLFSWKLRKSNGITFFRTGLFAILFALYSLSITDTVHLFLNNSRLIYLMEFLLLALFPLPLLVLVYHVCLTKFRPVLLVDIGVLTLNFCLQTALYFFTGLELRDMVWVTHTILVLSVIILIPTLALSGQKGGNRFRLFISFLPPLLGAAWDIVRFYLPGTHQKAVSFQLGVLLFIFLQTFYLVRSYLKFEQYRKAAYTDTLTGLGNRTAFEKRIMKLEKNASHYTSVWCVCADVNYLKRVNDTLGHKAGDELIRSTANALRLVKGNTGKLYRTGGDEFVLFEFNQSQKTMAEKRIQFEAALCRYNQKHNESLSVALGYDRLCEGETITELISRADSLMYKDKERKKGELHILSCMGESKEIQGTEHAKEESVSFPAGIASENTGERVSPESANAEIRREPPLRQRRKINTGRKARKAGRLKREKSGISAYRPQQPPR